MAALLRHNVYRIIRHAILTCEFQPGQELREQVLAEMYRVSRSPVRDSLLRLEQENLVTVLPRQGYRVNPIGSSDIDDVFGLRLIIEPACAAEAAAAPDSERLKLNAFRGFTDSEVGGDMFRTYNRNFHVTIAELAGNKRISAVEISLIEEIDRLVLASLKVSQNIIAADLVREHDAVIDAIQDRDAETAHKLARDHVTNARIRIRSALGLSELQQLSECQ